MKTKLVPGVGRIPYPAYRGKEPYIFISYAHVDSDKVFKEIKRLNEAGFHVWYDEGIAPGNEWTDEIANALSGCSVFVVMVTPRSAVRINVQNEINYALDEEKPFLAVHLEDTTLQGGMKLRMNSKQAILKYKMTDDEYEWKVTEALQRLGAIPNPEASAGTGKSVIKAPPTPAIVTPPVRRRKPWLIPAVIAAVLLVGAGLYALGPWKNKDSKEAGAPAVSDTVQTSEVAEASKGNEGPISSASDEPEEPATTEAPEATESPDPTEEPEPTETPVPTEEPDPTETPVPTEEPEPTETPVPTEEPEPTETPVPTEEPEPIVTAIDLLADEIVLTKGDIVSFGRYEQDEADSETEEIEWIVMEADDEKAVLLSRYALDCQPFNTSDSAVTWETCTLRQWLNDEFYNTAFLPEEQNRIAEVTVTADENPQYDFAHPGNDTQDKIYLLSANETERYFPEQSERNCLPTKTALSRGVQADDVNQAAKWWWLRTPGYSDNKAADVYSDGSIRYGGDLVDISEPVRPVITLLLQAPAEMIPSASDVLPSVEITGPVMEITLLNGETIEGPVSTIKTYFTLPEFEGLYLQGINELKQIWDEEEEVSHFETDDPFSPSVDWDLSFSLSSFSDVEEQDQSFSISTKDGTRLISMFTVSEMHVTGEKTLSVVQEEEYERPASEEKRGGTFAFEASGTVTVYLRDGTVYTSYPEAFDKFATANTYMDNSRHPDRAQTRDFWIEEAKTLTFSDDSKKTLESFGYLKIKGELADGEPVSKYIHVNGNDMRIFTLEKGIVPLEVHSIDHIEVDLSKTPDFSRVRTGRLTLTDGTVYELPVTAMEYDHFEGGGFVMPHRVYDYFFYTGSAEWSSDTGYAEEEQELPFSTFTEIEFLNDDQANLREREFPAIVKYRDGHTEQLNIRFYNYYGNYLDFYCPERYSIELYRSRFEIAKIEMG